MKPQQTPAAPDPTVVAPPPIKTTPALGQLGRIPAPAPQLELAAALQRRIPGRPTRGMY